ncbi:MAG: TrkA family potassium uptake protein [Spiroplasma sp.]|nr:TrkA family potassium uptake protein [Mycoplasmatales bacterium]
MEYVVIGLGRFGSAVALELEAIGHKVIAVDRDPLKCQALLDKVSTTMILDATNEKAIKEAAIDHADIVIVALGASAVNESLLTCLTLKEVGVETVIAKAASLKHGKILEKIGVDKVVRPEHDMGIRLARKLESGSFLDFIELSDEIRMDGIEVSNKVEHLANRTILDINLRKNYGINIVCIRRGDELIVPDSHTIILNNDILLVAGESDKVDRFEKELGIKK